MSLYYTNCRSFYTFISTSLSPFWIFSIVLNKIPTSDSMFFVFLLICVTYYGIVFILYHSFFDVLIFLLLCSKVLFHYTLYPFLPGCTHTLSSGSSLLVSLFCFLWFLILKILRGFYFLLNFPVCLSCMNIDPFY